eukprot:ANDGO_02630.mRNA.1 SNW/SKI-interacting protein
MSKEDRVLSTNTMAAVSLKKSQVLSLRDASLSLVPTVQRDTGQYVRPSGSATETMLAQTMEQVNSIVDDQRHKHGFSIVPQSIPSGSQAVQYVQVKAAEGSYRPEGTPDTRLVKVVQTQMDPLNPPSFRNKKKLVRPASPPAVVLSGSSSYANALVDGGGSMTVEQRHAAKQKEREEKEMWKVPPAVSNWKNRKGHIVPLHHRLALDGRRLDDMGALLIEGTQDGQHETPIERFANLSEALSIASAKAREELQEREKIEVQIAVKEKQREEEDLRKLRLAAAAAAQQHQQRHQHQQHQDRYHGHHADEGQRRGEGSGVRLRIADLDDERDRTDHEQHQRAGRGGRREERYYGRSRGDGGDEDYNERGGAGADEEQERRHRDRIREDRRRDRENLRRHKINERERDYTEEVALASGRGSSVSSIRNASIGDLSVVGDSVRVDANGNGDGDHERAYAGNLASSSAAGSSASSRAGDRVTGLYAGLSRGRPVEFVDAEQAARTEVRDTDADELGMKDRKRSRGFSSVDADDSENFSKRRRPVESK